MKTIAQIMKLQKEFGIIDLQEKLLTEDLFNARGILGAHILNYLEMGALFLPEKSSVNSNGDITPSRYFYDDFGTLEISQNFWEFVTKRENKKTFKEAFMYELDTRKLLLGVMEN